MRAYELEVDYAITIENGKELFLIEKTGEDLYLACETAGNDLVEHFYIVRISDVDDDAYVEVLKESKDFKSVYAMWHKLKSFDFFMDI